MTRTLTTLWVAGGGLMAAYLAVSPNATPAGTAHAVSSVQSSSASDIQAGDLNAQATRLRDRTHPVPLRPVSRNPFQFGAWRPGARVHAAAIAMAEPPAPVAPDSPLLALAGIAERDAPSGPIRTAIISGPSELFLVGEGDAVAGRYRVIRVDSNAVLLRDEGTGAELSLVLR